MLLVAHGFAATAAELTRSPSLSNEKRHEVRQDIDASPTPEHKCHCTCYVRRSGLLDLYRGVALKMSRPSAAAALRESFGDRRPPDISRKITACVSCRKLKVPIYG